MQTHSTVKKHRRKFFQTKSLYQAVVPVMQSEQEGKSVLLHCFVWILGPVLTCDNISICKYISLRAIQKSDCDESKRKNMPLNLLSFSIMSDHYRIALLNYLSCVAQQFLAKFIVFHQSPINAQSGWSRNAITEKSNN